MFDNERAEWRAKKLVRFVAEAVRDYSSVWLADILFLSGRVIY